MATTRGLPDLLTEYQEIGEFARHDDTVDLTMSSVLIPVLVAALAAAWTRPEWVFPLALGSIAVWLYWFSVKQRRMGFLLLRLQRARQIEQTAGLDHHLRLHQHDRDQGPWWSLDPRVRWRRLATVVRIRRVESFVSIALVWAWLWLLLPVVMPTNAAIVVVCVSAIAEAGDIAEWLRRRRLA